MRFQRRYDGDVLTESMNGRNLYELAPGLLWPKSTWVWLCRRREARLKNNEVAWPACAAARALYTCPVNSTVR